jgi:hypothetical protein
MPTFSIGPISIFIGSRSTPFGTPFAIEWRLAPRKLTNSDEGRLREERRHYAQEASDVGRSSGEGRAAFAPFKIFR